MPIPAIALLAVGGVALMAAASAKGRGGFRMLDGQCRLIKRQIHNEQQAVKLIAQLQGLYLDSLVEVTNTDPRANMQDPQGYYRQILGDPPGREVDMGGYSEWEPNLFVGAVATAMFKRAATPACLKKMGIPEDFGANVNPFGPDWSEWEPGAPGNFDQGDAIEAFQSFRDMIYEELSTNGYEEY
jgi:hypothetical protein